MYRKNRTHDAAWKLSLERLLLQALEILSGESVMFERFDTVTKEHLKGPHYEGRIVEVHAVAISDGLGGFSDPRDIRMTATIGMYPQGPNAREWRIRSGTFTPSFTFSIAACGSDERSVYHVKLSYGDWLGTSILPFVHVDPELNKPVPGALCTSQRGASGRDMRSRKEFDIVVKGQNAYADHFGSIDPETPIDLKKGDVQ